MSDVSNVPDLPEDWVAQGWTKEQAYKQDEEQHESWGDSGAQVSAADPSSVQSEHGESNG